MKKDRILLLMVVTATLWVYPFYYGIRHDARGMEDLNILSKVMLTVSTVPFGLLMAPLFLWIWLNIKRLFK